MIFSSKEKSIRNKSLKFSKQEVDITQTPLFFPEGYEKIFMFIYFISLPYLAGRIFQFFYVSNANIAIFLKLFNDSMFFLTWAIGYEIIASILLLYILKMSFSFSKKNNKIYGNGKFNPDFRRP